MSIRTYHDLKGLAREELAQFVAENIRVMGEDEALAILENPYCTTPICQTVAQNQRLAGFYSVRLRLVTHRRTPVAHATKLVHYLYWPDLLRISTDVKVAAPVRRAIDTQLLIRLDKLTLGERISSARRCSQTLIKVLLFDPDPKVFAALLVNSRLREEDLLVLATSPKARPEQLVMIAEDPRWSHRYAIRKALVTNPLTPRSTAASQLRYLSQGDLRKIHGSTETSVYLRRCIERMNQAPGVSLQPDRNR